MYLFYHVKTCDIVYYQVDTYDTWALPQICALLAHSSYRNSGAPNSHIIVLLNIQSAEYYDYPDKTKMRVPNTKNEIEYR